MNGMYISAAIALVGGGAAIGGLAVVSLGIKRDDHPDGFPGYTNNRIARATRRMTGARARSSELGREASRHRQETLQI